MSFYLYSYQSLFPTITLFSPVIIFLIMIDAALPNTIVKWKNRIAKPMKVSAKPM